MNKFFISLVASFLITTNLLIGNLPNIKVEMSNSSENETVITFNIALEKKQLMYQNSIDISTNTNGVTLSKWQPNKKPSNDYDPAFNEVLAYSDSFKIITTAKKDADSDVTSANIFFSFLLNNSKKIIEKNYNLSLFPKQEVTGKKETTKTSTTPQEKHVKESSKKTNPQTIWGYITEFSNWIQGLLRHTSSIWLRLLLAFLLGLLMSFTPCIYPMIPITAGILQSQKSTSIWQSFGLALSYTLGISTTFAVFGLTAAFTGHMFGQLLVHPVFILFIVFILAYMGLSMFGLYEIYIPKSFQDGNSNHKGGSFASTFVFGAISGSVASPCLSPGLALLLTIVATLGSKILGFILLFVFGLGLSVPLLIIGTFSNSMNVIPRAGGWMVEVKKLFGFLLLGMCIHFLKGILPESFISWLITVFIFGTGVYYLQSISKYDTTFWRRLKSLIGIGLIALSVFLGIQAIYKTHAPHISCAYTGWETDFDSAKKDAIRLNKLMLIDCGADWCSICKAIDKFVFEDQKIKNELCNFVTIKVDATNQGNPTFVSLQSKYEITGVPAILLIDPKNDKLLKRWSGELYAKSKTEFATELQRLAKEY